MHNTFVSRLLKVPAENNVLTAISEWMCLCREIKEIPKVWFLGSRIPLSLFTVLSFMLCHVIFIFLVLPCFLYQLMLINCCFVLAVRTVHSKRRQKEWWGFSHSWLCFDSDGIWWSGNRLQPNTHSHCTHQLFIAAGAGDTYEHVGERLRSWSSWGQGINTLARHRDQGHVKNQVFKILAPVQ